MFLAMQNSHTDLCLDMSVCSFCSSAYLFPCLLKRYATSVPKIWPKNKKHFMGK